MEQTEKIIKSKLIWGIEDIAEQLNVSISFIRSEIKRGHLPKMKMGRRILVSCDDLLNYIYRHRGIADMGFQTLKDEGLCD